MKQVIYNYLSKRINHKNYYGLQTDLSSEDPDNSGMMDSEKFVRCLSKNHMKFGDHEREGLVTKLQNEMNQVNYQDFLKYSFLCHLFFNHMMLEDAMREAD